MSSARTDTRQAMVQEHLGDYARYAPTDVSVKVGCVGSVSEDPSPDHRIKTLGLNTPKMQPNQHRSDVSKMKIDTKAATGPPMTADVGDSGPA